MDGRQKNRHADRRQPVVESMPKDEISEERKLHPGGFQLRSVVFKANRVRRGTADRRWPLRAELDKYLWENARKNIITLPPFT